MQPVKSVSGFYIDNVIDEEVHYFHNRFYDVIEAILQDVAHFVGDAERYDDMTMIVVKKV